MNTEFWGTSQNTLTRTDLDKFILVYLESSRGTAASSAHNVNRYPTEVVKSLQFYLFFILKYFKRAIFLEFSFQTHV